MFATPVGNPELKNLYQILFLFYKESFMLFKKAVNNGLTLELNTPFDFQLISNFVFFNFKASSAKWKTLEKNNLLLLDYLVSFELLNALFFLK